MKNRYVNPKNRNIDFYLEEISDMEFEVDYIKPHSTAGDITPLGLYQWQALTVLKDGDDDVYDGLGWTPLKAVKDLYKLIKKCKGEI